MTPDSHFTKRFSFVEARSPNISPSRLQRLLVSAGMLSVLILAGCSALISSATVDLTDNLSQAILNNNDLATVEAGAPAYLLMVDSLLYRDPESEPLLRAAASIYTAYTDVFVKDTARAQKLTDKALGYALKAVCAGRQEACSLRRKSFQEFEEIVAALEVRDVPSLYALGSA